VLQQQTSDGAARRPNDSITCSIADAIHPDRIGSDIHNWGLGTGQGRPSSMRCPTRRSRSCSDRLMRQLWRTTTSNSAAGSHRAARRFNEHVTDVANWWCREPVRPPRFLHGTQRKSTYCRCCTSPTMQRHSLRHSRAGRRWVRVRLAFDDLLWSGLGPLAPMSALPDQQSRAGMLPTEESNVCDGAPRSARSVRPAPPPASNAARVIARAESLRTTLPRQPRICQKSYPPT